MTDEDETRSEMVRISPSEKEQLDEIKRVMYNTDSVPYGEVIGRLADLFEQANQYP